MLSYAKVNRRLRPWSCDKVKLQSAITIADCNLSFKYVILTIRLRIITMIISRRRSLQYFRYKLCSNFTFINVMLYCYMVLSRFKTLRYKQRKNRRSWRSKCLYIFSNVSSLKNGQSACPSYFYLLNPLVLTFKRLGVLARVLKKVFKRRCWGLTLLLRPNVIVCLKSKGSRMGKGKGAAIGVVFFKKPGSKIAEASNLHPKRAYLVANLLSSVLSNTIIVIR